MFSTSNVHTTNYGSCILIRKYAAVCEEFRTRRAEFTSEYCREFGLRGTIRYPHELEAVPQFADWLHEAVAAASQSSTKPSDDVVDASKLPELRATGYRAMYANGMHLRIRTAEEEKITCDSAVASAVWKRSQRSESEAGGRVDKMEYVGWIKWNTSGG
jgi:hypothetical protein